MFCPRDRRSDTGATLVEMLVALSILSTAGLAVLAGLQLSVKASDIHRKSATSGANVRNYAEAIERYVEQGAGNYKKCAGDGAYGAGVVGFSFGGIDDYTITQVETSRLVESKIGTADDPWEPCPSAGAEDNGVQRLKLTIRNDDGRGGETLYVIVRRPCSSSLPCVD